MKLSLAVAAVLLEGFLSDIVPQGVVADRNDPTTESTTEMMMTPEEGFFLHHRGIEEEQEEEEEDTTTTPMMITKEEYVRAHVAKSLEQYGNDFATATTPSPKDNEPEGGGNRLRRTRIGASATLVLARPLVNGRCLEQFSFTTLEGCTDQGVDAFIQALEDKLTMVNCSAFGVWNELKNATGWGDDFWTNWWSFLWDECWTNFWNRDSIRFKLWELFDGADIKVKAYLDGGTDWNDLKQTRRTNGWDTKYRLDTMMFPVDHFYYGPTRRGVVEFPSTIVTNLANCRTNAVYCCWVQDIQANDGNGDCDEPYDYASGCEDKDPADNTDICFVNMTRAPKSARVPDGFALYPGETEGDAHCHGLAWTNEVLDYRTIFRGNTLVHVALADHLRNRGYAKEVPGSPMCACAEQMAVVSRADCSEPRLRHRVTFRYSTEGGFEIVKSNDFEVSFPACQGLGPGTANDLESFMEKLLAEWKINQNQYKEFEKAVVGDCKVPTKKFLAAKILEHDLKYNPGVIPGPNNFVAAAPQQLP